MHYATRYKIPLNKYMQFGYAENGICRFKFYKWLCPTTLTGLIIKFECNAKDYNDNLSETVELEKTYIDDMLRIQHR